MYMTICLLIISIFIIIILIWHIFKLRKQKNEIILENENVIVGLQKMIDDIRIENHENKNQIMLIKGMTTNHNIQNYIDSIYNEPISENSRLRKELNRIRLDGLKGLLYIKLTKLVDKNIEYDIDISKEITTFRLNNPNTMIDIIRVIGVLLDNAIEYVENIAEKYIYVEIYINNRNLYISIINPLEEKIEIKKIYKAGYTTKTYGHGYGLALVKKIIGSNKLLCLKTTMKDNQMHQVLKVKNM